jgi:hypothetical protein
MGYGLQYDIPGLFEFLTHTPESALRKMLVDNKPFTEAHFSTLMKMVRNCNESKFSEHAEKGDFPKIKFGPAETAIKEKFWADCFATLSSRGLLNPAEKKTAA